MRKFLYLLIAVLASLAFTACSGCTINNDVKAGFVYSMQTNGDADGHFSAAFGLATFDINGKADYAFSMSNDSTIVLFEDINAVSLDDALVVKSNANYDAALRTDAWLNEQLKITTYSGTYLLHIEGYVIEQLTGIKFEVNRTFTNRDVPGDCSEQDEA